MGRSDPRWQDASKIYVDGKKTVTCNHCRQIWKNTSLLRVTEHMMTCRMLPEDRYEVYGRDEPPAKQAKIAEEVWKWTKRDEERADRELAEAIYSSGVPFSFVENPAFRRFLRCLRPAYTPPSRYKLAGPILEATYKETKEKMSQVLQKSPKQITLITDGWTNLRGESIVNYVAVTRKHAIFLKSTPTGQQRHTGKYIADGVAEVVKELSPSNIVAICTDNASNMVAAEALLGQQFPEVLMLGCAAHIVNLTVNDVLALTSINNLMRIIIEVVKYFKGSYILVGLLNSASESLGRRRKALQLPGNTRWQGKLNTIDSLVNNKDFLEIVVQHPESALPEHPTGEQKAKFNRIRSVLLSYRFWEQISTLQRLLRPFLEVTLALESTRPRGSRIYAYFKHLAQTTYAATTLPIQDVKNAIGRRFQQVHKPIYTIAYICDPLAREERPVEVTPAMWAEIEDYLQKRYTDDLDQASGVYTELRSCWNRTGAYKGQVNWNSFKGFMDPGDWWLDQGCSEDMQELAIYALSINPTTGAAERNWSTHGFLHNKSRNRLANKRVEKLVYLFNNLRVRDSVNHEDAEYFNQDEVEEMDDGDGGIIIEPTELFCNTKDDEGDISQVIPVSEMPPEEPYEDAEA